MSASRHVTYLRALGPLFVVALACPALTACGSDLGPSAARYGLCGNAGGVDRLVVERMNLLPQNHPRFTFPAKITVSDPVKARSVAHAVCALPPMPRGPMSCGADMGITYRLGFAAGARKLPPVRADVGGCTGVSGIGQTRWTARSPGFWRALGAAMGIAQPSQPTFSGTTS